MQRDTIVVLSAQNNNQADSKLRQMLDTSEKNEEPASRCSVEKRKNKVLSARKCDLVKCRYGYSVSCLQCHFTELHRLEILSCYGEGDCLLVLLCIDSFADDSDALCCLENVPYRGDRVL